MQRFLPVAEFLGQGSNVYIFPAMGMAVWATEARRVTDEMFIVAAQVVVEQVTDANHANGLLYPPISNILNAWLHVAERFAAHMFDKGLARVARPKDGIMATGYRVPRQEPSQTPTGHHYLPPQLFSPKFSVSGIRHN